MLARCFLRSSYCHLDPCWLLPSYTKQTKPNICFSKALKVKRPVPYTNIDINTRKREKDQLCKQINLLVRSEKKRRKEKRKENLIFRLADRVLGFIMFCYGVFSVRPPMASLSSLTPPARSISSPSYYLFCFIITSIQVLFYLPLL